MSDTTQLVVIGAGPGGYAAAFYAADRGMKVALVDPSPNPGGVCLYRGCIPSKALLHVAKVVNEAKHASAWGVTFTDPKIDLDQVRGFKDKVVSQLTGGVGQVGRMRKINYIQGTASFRDAWTLDIAGVDGKDSTLTFEHAVIATGSVIHCRISSALSFLPTPSSGLVLLPLPATAWHTEHFCAS